MCEEVYVCVCGLVYRGEGKGQCDREMPPGHSSDRKRETDRQTDREGERETNKHAETVRKGARYGEEMKIKAKKKASLVFFK